MTKTEFEATVEFDDGSTAELEMAADKSWDSFLNYFGDAQHVYCVTYSQSPAFIYKMFQNQDLAVDSREVIVGDNQHDDYRRSLKNTSNAKKIAAQLESLRQDGDLLIHTVDSARVLLHTKLYIVENQDGSRTLICGSANLSKQAWQGSKQTTVNIAWRTDGDTPVDDWFERLYAFHKDYATPFMAYVVTTSLPPDTSLMSAASKQISSKVGRSSESPSRSIQSVSLSLARSNQLQVILSSALLLMNMSLLSERKRLPDGEEHSPFYYLAAAVDTDGQHTDLFRRGVSV